MPGTPLELKSQVVQAGAGAGKTRSLINKVREIFEAYRQQESVPRLVVTTFTRKATQELRERLVAQACADQDFDFLEYVSDPSLLHISTIHGVLHLFLSQVSHLIGLDAGFQLASESEATEIAKKALRAVLREPENQKTWIENYNFSYLLNILVRYTAVKDENPEIRPADLSDLEWARTATVQSWRERLVHVAEEVLAGPVADGQWVEFAEELTVFAGRFDGTTAMFEGRPKPPRWSEKSGVPKSDKDRWLRQFNDMRDRIEALEQEKESWPLSVGIWSDFELVAERFREVFWDLKLKTGSLTAADLELMSLRVLREKDYLGGLFAQSWDYWLIDEFQDTSPLQLQLLKHLVGEAPTFMVGDPQQSIYLFRGANSDIFLERIAQAEKENIALYLKQNYRSHPPLLLFINAVCEQLGDAFEPMSPRRDVIAEDPLDVAEILECDSFETELQAVADRIHRLRDAGARWDDICILSRSHKNLLEAAKALKSLGAPTHTHAPSGFWRRREIMDALSLLKFLVNAHDDANLVTLLRSPWFRVDDGQLAEWARGPGMSLWARILRLQVDHPVVARLMSYLDLRGEQGYLAAFERAMRESHMIDLALFEDPVGRRESNLWKLLIKLKDEERRPGFHVLSLIQEMEREFSSGEDSKEGDAMAAQEPDCINLMTVHGSKGLEFDHVILLGAGQKPNLTLSQKFCHHRERGCFSFRIADAESATNQATCLESQEVRGWRERELKEQDRWLYVALTRAKRSVTISVSPSGGDTGSWADRMALGARWAAPAGAGPYVCEVRQGPFESRPFQRDDALSVSVRPIWTPAESSKVEVARASRIAVTQLIQQDLRPHVSISTLLDRVSKSAQGVWIHRLLEGLKSGAAASTDWRSRLNADESEILDFVARLDEPPMQTLMRSGDAEWGFQLQTAKGLLEGQIDLWGRDDAGNLWIVDYKTGSDRYKALALHQLGIYAWALRQMGIRAERTYLGLIYASDRQTHIEELSEELLLRLERELGVPQ